VTTRARSASALLVLLLVAAPAHAAPVGTGAPLAVLGLEAESAHDVAAQTLTNELRQAVVDSAGHSLYVSNPALLLAAGSAKCDLAPFGRRYGPETDRGIDTGCQRSIKTRLGIGQLLWGHLYEEGGTLRAKVHVFRDGRPGRVETLAYDASAPKRLAQRFYRKLIEPESSGDVRLTGDASFEGTELWVDGKVEGTYKPGLELTLSTGEHAFELRRESRVVARAKAPVTTGKASEVRLAFVPRTDLDPTAGLRDSPPVVVTSGAPWKRTAGFVGLGVGAAGLVGAGLFYALRQREENDLEERCRAQAACLPEARPSIDRSERWEALSWASLGLGLASAGVGTFLLFTAPKSSADRAAFGLRVRAGGVPLPGGGLSTFVLEGF
jgi:hypothetical protein